jgi:TRAP-type mannitol/chloroaromatic compound transport system permease small subunit
MKPLLAVSTAIDRVNELIGKAVSWLILVAVLVSATNAIIRKTLNTSSNAWLELQWYLFGAAFLLAAAYTLKQNEHIRIDIVYGALPRRAQHWIDLLGHLLFLMPFTVLMLWLLVPYVGRSMCLPYFIPEGRFCLREVSTNAGGLVIWPAKALLLGGFVLLFFQGISEIIKKAAIMSGELPDPSPFLTAHEQAERDAAALARELAGGDLPGNGPDGGSRA